MRRHELTPEQWFLIRDRPPGKAGDPGRTTENDRRFVNAVLLIARTGAGWLTDRGKARTRFNRWCKRGVRQRVLEALNGDADLKHLLLDSSVVRAHQHSAGAKGGFAKCVW